MHLVWAGGILNEMGGHMSAEYQERFGEWIRKRLQTGHLRVEFRKADNSLRVMDCTLQKEYVPEEAAPKTKTVKKRGSSITVWDIDKQAWRTITYDRIIAVYAETELREGELAWETRTKESNRT